MAEATKQFFIETRLRALVKSLIYRILSIAGVGILTWVITKDIKQAFTITIFVQIFLMILYYSYERVWNKINWGRKLKKMIKRAAKPRAAFLPKTM